MPMTIARWISGYHYKSGKGRYINLYYADDTRAKKYEPEEKDGSVRHTYGIQLDFFKRILIFESEGKSA